ncbi:hypothetical protein O181_040059 [Austropuccinia psidii MF-1]|uniref:Uncharacterized protein n=1 Tax=Austropuccinia psidii MF-1 TaxID=1389203 RepID=A0A9Q3DBH8_9BASI|nr:hypothetical protein [Austropuccinia psidii MF-1]
MLPRCPQDMPLTAPFSHPPNPLHLLPSLCPCSSLPRAFKMRLQYHPPISTLTTPYASTPPPLTILTLQQSPQDMPPTLPSTPLTPPPTHPILPAAYHPYTKVLDP